MQGIERTNSRHLADIGSQTACHFVQFDHTHTTPIFFKCLTSRSTVRFSHGKHNVASRLDNRMSTRPPLGVRQKIGLREITIGLFDVSFEQRAGVNVQRHSAAISVQTKGLQYPSLTLGASHGSRRFRSTPLKPPFVDTALENRGISNRSE